MALSAEMVNHKLTITPFGLTDTSPGNKADPAMRLAMNGETFSLAC